MSNTPPLLQCQGFRRYGGAFTLGPVNWVQCTNIAVVNLTFTQSDEPETTLPACMTCWEEALVNEQIQIIRAAPILDDADATGEEK